MKGTKTVSRLNTGLRKSSILERVFTPSKYFFKNSYCFRRRTWFYEKN